MIPDRFDPTLSDRKVRQFTLSLSFLSDFDGLQPKWGPIGYFTYKRTYARPTCDCDDPHTCGHPTEEFWQTCKRVVEGVYNIQKRHCRGLSLPWDEPKAQNSAQEMFTRMWEFKFTPPGRGLAQMGAPFMLEKGGACLNNCAFVSSEHIAEDFAGPFTFLMDMSMLGVGVGGDTRGAGKVKIGKPKFTDVLHVVPDDREGWVALVKTVLNAFVGRGTFPDVIDFSLVRPKGRRIRGFGGTASGPGPLAKLVKSIVRTLMPEEVEFQFEESFDEDGKISRLQTITKGPGEPYRIGSSDITDVFNMIGACVVAGGVRRCIPKGTLVHTSEGLIPIEDVKVGSSVMTSQGYSLVTDWMNQGVQPISQITTQMGVFEATDKHEIAIISDTQGGYQWKRLLEMEPGDRMVFVDRPIEGAGVPLPAFHYEAPPSSTTCVDITIPPLTPDVAWLMGLFAGDGYVHLEAGSGEISITVAEDQPQIKDKAVEVLSLFGVHVGVGVPVEDNRCFKVRVKSKQLALYFSQFKQPKIPLTVPTFVMKGRPEIRAAYVAGLADADGSFKTRPMLAAASVYPRYLEQVQAVLASLGIPSRIKLKRDAVGSWQPLFNLNIVGAKAKSQFIRRVAPFILKFQDDAQTGRSGNDYGFPAEMALADGVSGWAEGRMAWSRYSRQITVAKLEEIKGCTVTLVPVEVLDIEHGVRDDFTYDITVAAGEFVVQGGYLVHNSAEIMFGEADDQEFRNLKDPSTLRPMDARMAVLQSNLLTTPEHAVDRRQELQTEITALQEQIDLHPLRSHRWASNNSIFGHVGMDYTEVGESIAMNGEPGIFWLKNAQDYGRMIDPANFKDKRAKGANPCFVGDTLIATADGRGAVSIKQLVDEGNDIPVYSMDPKTGMVEIKMARNPRKTRESSPVVEITLEDGSTLRVTPDHKMYLLDGVTCEAKDLQPGDSLPRFQKRLEKVKKGGRDYVRVYCNTRNQRENKIFEHRLVAKFNDPEKWYATFDEAKQSGWVKGGLVVHHKDYNPLNNAPENLEIMTFRDHATLHGSVDNKGDKNPMWGKSHSANTRKKIGLKTSERCLDPLFRGKLSRAHTAAEREAASKRMSTQKKVDNLAYYKEQEAQTDLDTVWAGNRLYAVRCCETCAEEFVVAWGMRGQSYCSRSCMNKAESHIVARKAGQAIAFTNKQRQTLHKQVQAYKTLEVALGRDPMKKEWESACRDEGTPFRFRRAGSTTNPHALTGFKHLKEMSVGYNHRVKSVRLLDHEEPVYNVSVTDNHTLGVVTKSLGGNLDGVYTAQCVEQTLESFELCCVSGDMRITTKTGSPPIRDMVGQEVDVWNGEVWSTVIPFVAAQGKTLFRVHLSDGSYLDCTDDHKWSVLLQGKRKYRQVETKDLVLGSKLAPFNITLPGEGVDVPFAYEWGFFTGDGWVEHDSKQVMSALHGPDRKLEGILRGKVYKEQQPEGYANPFVRINFTGYFREAHPEDYMARAVALNDKHRGLPDWIFSMNRESTLRFVAGWIEADGNICKQVHMDNYRVFGTESKMRDLQMLLRRVGVNHASVYLMTEAGETLVINKRETTRNHDLWVCLIPSYECEEISHHCHLKVAHRFGSRYVTNNSHPLVAPKQKIVDVEELLGEHTTYCFSEPKKHMGVFGNVLTYQCLVETYPAHHDTYADFQRTLKFAYLYAKTVTLMKTHDPRTNAVMNRNRRIGCSMSGIRQAIEKFGRRKFLNWCDTGYGYISELDTLYSEWLGTPLSIKTTSVKPSGTVSLLCGATPGIHPPHSEFYIRNIRVNSHSPLLSIARDAGYKVEADAYADSTFVISFPVKTENCHKGKKDVSIWEQVALAADLQRYWADNQVSVTVTFTAAEAKEIPTVLEVFEDRLKAISFLPLLDDHGYVQAPYIAISEDEYKAELARIRPMDLSATKKEVEDEFCTTDACEIRAFTSSATN